MWAHLWKTIELNYGGLWSDVYAQNTAVYGQRCTSCYWKRDTGAKCRRCLELNPEKLARSQSSLSWLLVWEAQSILAEPDAGRLESISAITKYGGTVLRSKCKTVLNVENRWVARQVEHLYHRDRPTKNRAKHHSSQFDCLLLVLRGKLQSTSQATAEDKNTWIVSSWLSFVVWLWKS